MSSQERNVVYDRFFKSYPSGWERADSFVVYLDGIRYLPKLGFTFFDMKIIFSILFLWCHFMVLSQVKLLVQPGFQWHESTAWSPAGVPTANDSVLIHGPTFVMPDSTAYARYVFVGSKGVLEIQRDIPTNTPGRLFIANSPKVGLENEGMVSNGGRIDIDISGSTGLVNNGIFEILTKAKLNVDSCFTDGISTGSNAPALLDNYGTINISRASRNGLVNGDSVHNHSGAVTMITNISEDGEHGILNYQTHTIVNQGKIILDNIHRNGIFNAGTIFNEDTLIINDISVAGINNINVEGGSAVLSNQSDGYISISGARNGLVNGYLFGDQSVLDNVGQIYVDGSIDVGIENYSTILISSGGLISVTNTIGIPFVSNADSVLDCNGELDVIN